MEIYVRAIESAEDTWGIIRAIPDYELVVGTLLFQEIFSLAPEALGLYSFGEEFNEDNESDDNIPKNLFQHPSFCTHAKAVVTMLESVIQSLAGDDVSSLGETLQQLGARHVSYGVHPAHYSVVQTALLRTLEKGLGDHWTADVRKGWSAVFNFISKGMQAGAGAEVEIIKVRRREYVRRQSATMRMQIIQKSSGTTRLSTSRFHDSGTERRKSGVRKNQAPQLPTRSSREARLPSMIPSQQASPAIHKTLDDNEDGTASTSCIDDDEMFSSGESSSSVSSLQKSTQALALS